MGKIIRNKQFALYGTGACAQFKMSKILDESEGNYLETYNLFVDAAKAKEGASGGSARSYNWSEKILLRLGVADIGLFLNGIRLNFDPTKAKGYDAAKPGSGKFEIYHDPGKGGPSEGQHIKKMSIMKGERSGYIINFYSKQKDKTNSFIVPLSDEQMVIFKVLLEEAVKLITGFYDDGVEAQVKEKE